MLRFLYRAALHVHPPYFRKRFADEMLAIFDEAQSPLAQAELLADAVVSLVRQWTVRPRFWEESVLGSDPVGSRAECRVVDDGVRLGASKIS